MKKEPWEKLLDKHELDDEPAQMIMDNTCAHEWGTPFDGRVKCKKCGSYVRERDVFP